MSNPEKYPCGCAMTSSAYCVEHGKPSPSQSCEHDKGDHWDSNINYSGFATVRKYERNKCPYCKPTAVEPLGNPDIGYGWVTLCSNPHKAVEPSDKIIGAKITPYPFKDNGSNKTHIDLSDVGKQACKPVEPKTPQQLASDSAKIAIDEFDKNNSVAGRKFYGTVEPSWESIDRKEAEKVDRAILDALPVEPSVEEIAEEIVSKYFGKGIKTDLEVSIAEALRNERNRHG